MNPSVNRIKKCLISVWDKKGLEILAPLLKEFEIEVYSTGGTAKHLEETLGLKVTQVDNLTEYPEMLGGRVKTLHPKVFGGILARRDEKKDLEETQRYGIPLFDLVVVNLYPFQEHLNEERLAQVPFVDIGGPSMIRAAAKNHEAVTVLSSPDDYSKFVTDIKENEGGSSLSFRIQMAQKTFERTSHYDSLIAGEWREKSEFPTELNLLPQQKLRYGENPHQKACFVGTPDWKCLQGKELSYNNLLDSEAAIRITNEFSDCAVAIVKHNNPCGAASFNGQLCEIFSKALSGDSKSAFGGVVSVNQEIDGTTASKICETFFEAIIAPSFSTEALKIFSTKKNLRLIEWKNPISSSYEIRPAMGGWLIQTIDTPKEKNNWHAVTQVSEYRKFETDMNFSMRICKQVRSNAIVIAKNGMTLGIGAGQMSRVDSVKIALEKASAFDMKGSVLASDAFFPFRDNIDLLKNSGVEALIQPGGSQRDGEVIQACNELGIVMVYTGIRHFRH